MTLKELEIGDIFCNVKDKRQLKFIVRGSSMFNIGYGSATRFCLDTRDGSIVSKACKIEVKKLGVSKFAEKYKLSPFSKTYIQ